MHVGRGQADGDEVERHEGAGDDREHAGVARLALGVLDREAQRLVGGEQQQHDQERDQRRLVPHPPVAPGRLGPDRAGDQAADAEDQRHVDRHVGAHVPAAVAGAQVADGQHAAEDEPAQRDDRQRHVDVEDLLHEALVGVQRRVEEHQRQSAAAIVMRVASERPRRPLAVGGAKALAQSSRRKSNTA